MNPALELRDIHLPGGVSWWPPAPGWWVLGAMLLFAVGVAVSYLLRRHRRARVRRATLRAIETLRAGYAGDQDGVRVVTELSTLLRRACITSFPRKTVAGLTGEHWLGFLDELAASAGTTEGGRLFRDGPGRALLTAPYQPGVEVNTAALLEAAAAVARALPDSGRRAA